MKKTLLALCSYMLVIVFVFNLLPLQAMALETGAPSAAQDIQTDATEVTVLEEIEENRTQFSKEFLLSSGLHMTAVYATAVHYEQDGQWLDIDNTLVSTGLDGSAAYTNTAGIWDVSFPQQLTADSRITVTRDGYTLSFGMGGAIHSGDAGIDPPIGSGSQIMSAGEEAQAIPGLTAYSIQDAAVSTAQIETADAAPVQLPADSYAETVLTTVHSRLSYPAVYGGAGITYDLNASQLKESIIIPDYSSTLLGYSYILETGDLTPVLREDSHIDFLAPDGETVVLVMPAPYLVDDALEYCGDVDVTLTPYRTGYMLTYLLPAEWMAAEDRAYPVVLDPVIQPDMDINNVCDQTVFQYRTYDYEWGILECGYDVDWAIERFFLKYENLPALTSADVIVNAQVSLYLAASSSNSCPVEVHKVNGTWASETITWSNAPSHDSTVEDFQIAQAEGWYTWNVTDIARDWYTGDNTGMIFKASGAVEAAAQRNWKQFYSCNYSDSLAPTLIIQFRNNNGLESYWDYTASSAGRAGTGYINDYTGNLVWVREDTGFGGTRMPVTISHVYNANDSLNNIFGLGYGWRTNFNQRVCQWSENSNYYIWEDSDGTKHYFYYVSYGTYKDEDGLELTLTTTGSGTETYAITDKYGNKSFFDSSGRLTKLQNNQQTASSISIAYASGYQISSVTDGAGRVYSFSYPGGLLSRIAFNGKGSTELSYVTFGYSASRLTSITDKDGAVCSYSYTTNNLLSSALDVDGYSLNYTYNRIAAGQPSRVSSVTEYDGGVQGGTLSIEYAQNQTTFTDHNGNKQIMQFNNWGNTVSIQDGLGRAQFARYATDTSASAKGNQLTVASKLQYSSFLSNEETSSRNNLITNGDFSNGLTGWTVIGSASGNAISTVSSPAAPAMDTYILSIQGSHTEAKGRSQTVAVSGASGDTFVLGGWAKGTSVPLDPEDTACPSDFAVKATFNYTDGTKKDFFARFNPYVDSSVSWQFAAAPMVAEKAYASITVAVIYNYNANTVSFDGIQLYKEAFGNSYTYDSQGNVTAVKDLQAQTTTYEYTNNNLTAQILPTGAKLTYTYDNYHNVKTATSDTGIVYSFGYDSYGNNTSVSIGGNLASYAAYSSDGNRLVSATDTLGNVTTYGYDENTNVLNWVQYPNNTESNRTNYTYDAMYRLASASASVGALSSGTALTASYTYEDDMLAKIETGSTTYSFSYGNFALRSSIRIGSRTLASYSYTSRDHYLSSLDYGNGDKVQYTYDNYGRVTKQTYEDGDTVSYTYDSSGALATVTDSATGVTTTYYYDFTGRLLRYKEESTGLSHTVGYGYDHINNLTSLVETINAASYTTSYAYDDDNRVTSVTNGSTSKSYAYDSYGRVSTRTTKNGTSTVLTDTLGYYTPMSGGTSGFVGSLRTAAAGYDVTYSYSYDANGNILYISDGTNTTTYAYDSANQLIRENNQAANKTWMWTYDGGGNITSRTEYPYSDSALGTPVETVSYTYGDSEWGDLLTGYNGSTITSDTIGNMLSDGTWTYTWEHGRDLASMSDGTATWTYTYNADGMRTSRSNGTTAYNYIYNGSSLSQMTVGSDTLYFAYGSSTPMSVTYNGTTYYYVTNLQGDIVAILDSAGTAVVTYAYDAWGNPLSISGSMADTLGTHNPLRYRGYVYDVETGLYYISSRYYDPEISRWISADSVIAGVSGSIQGYNMFAYCFNNPVNMSDSSGHWPQWMKNAANWVNNNIIQPVANFFSPSTNTISGQFQDGIFRGSGSLTGGYSEINGRLQVNSKDSKNNGMLGGFAKVSTGNASGKIGIGNDNVALSLKGVGDGLTATAQAGIQYKNGAGLAAKAKAAVLTGRVTAELELFGWQIEFGVSGDLLSVGAEAMIGVFPDEGFTAKANVGAGLFGAGFVFRVKPAQ